MGKAVSLGIHESQSRLWENAVGRGRPFWARFFPIARQVFHEACANVAPEAFHFAINQVERSFIRVEADEVTYNLHVLARFELELALLAGDLQAADVPAAWNEKYAQLPGHHARDRRGGVSARHPLEPRPDRLLPDVHARQRMPPPNSMRGRPRTSATSTGRWPPASSAACSAGSARRSTATAAATRQPVHRTGDRPAAPDPQPLIAALTRKYGELYAL